MEETKTVTIPRNEYDELIRKSLMLDTVIMSMYDERDCTVEQALSLVKAMSLEAMI